MAGANGVFIEDDDAGHVSYFPEHTWESWIGDNYHAKSYHVTKGPGAFVTFDFDGSYVAYYSDMNYDHGEFTIFLDGDVVFQGTSYAPGLQTQLLLFNTSVPAGTHNLTIQNAINLPTRMGVDYFIYEPLPATPSSPASSGTTHAKIYSIVGAACAVLLVMIGMALVVVARRRRSRRTPPADARVDALPLPPRYIQLEAPPASPLPRGEARLDTSLVDAIPLPPPSYTQSESLAVSPGPQGKVGLNVLRD